MKKLLATAVTFLFATALASAWQYPAGGAPSSSPTWGLGRGSSEPKREKPPEFRNLTGLVLDKADSPVQDAVVYLKNRKTNKVLTYVANADGAYRFPSLSRRDDYEVYAELKGQKSPVKTLSSFDNRTNAKINLYVESEDAKNAEKKDEQAAKQDVKQEEKKEVKQEVKQEEPKEEKKDPPK